MSTELKIFEHPQFGRIRTIIEDGKTLFCGLDAARALEYADTDSAIRRHCRYPLKRRVPHPQNSEKTIEMTFITDGDLCRLAAKSELPGADAFEKWIFDEVIPTVLRTGSYTAPTAPRLSPEVSPGGLAKLISVNRQIILAAGGSPQDVCQMAAGVFQLWCLPVPKSLSKQVPGQISWFAEFDVPPAAQQPRAGA